MAGGFSLHTTWALVGDRSRYRFAAWLADIPYEDWDTKRCVWISQEPVQEAQPEDVCLQSVHVPPGIRLCVLPDSEAAWTERLARFSFCILLEEFPWQKDSSEEILRALESVFPRPVTAVLLMKQQHRAGSTDLDKVAETLSAARKAYQKQGFPVYIGDRSRLSDVFSLRDSLLEKHREILRDELLLLRDRMAEFEAEDYAVFLAACDAPRGCLGVEMKEAVFSYRTVRRSGEACLWTAWNKIARGILFAAGRQGNLCETLRMYEDILKATDLPLWADWDVAQERVQVEAVLKAAFLAHMRVPARYDKRIVWEAVRGESAYARLLLESGAHLAYWKKYREFVTEHVRSILLERLNKYCTHWEGLIS